MNEIFFCENIILSVTLFMSREGFFELFTADFIWSDVYISDIQHLCHTAEEQLIIKWLGTSDELWEFRYLGSTILHVAAIYDCSQLIEFICNYGRIDVNTQQDSGNTPLHAAVTNNNYNVVKTLIQNKCHVNVKNNPGQTALDCAQGKSDEIKKLLQQV